ncbi:hypothetical protein WDU94_011341 [Cyamophila willieti]
MNSLLNGESKMNSLLNEESKIKSLRNEDSKTNSLLNEDSKINSLLNGESKMNSLLNEESKIKSLRNEDSKTDSLLNEDSKINSLLNGVSKMNSLLNEESKIKSLRNEDSKTNSLLNEETKINSLLNGESKMNSLLNEESKMNSLLSEKSKIINSLPNEGSKTNSLLNGETKINSLLNKESQGESIKFVPQKGNNVEYGFRSACSQVLATAGLYCFDITCGMCFGMSTVIVGSLHQKVASSQTILQSPDLILSDEQSSWLGSIVFLFRPVGSIVSGSLIQYFGRTRLMIAMGIPLCVGWVTLYLAQSIPIILLGTVCIGLGVGCVEAPILAHIGESCEPRLRGSLSSLTIAALKLGVAIIFFINALTDWRATMLLSAAFSIFTTIMLAIIPESPTWLVSKGRLKDAERSLRWMRGWSKKPKVRVEFERLVQKTHTATLNNTQSQAQGQFTHLRRPEFQRPFIMILILYIITLIPSLLPMRPFFVQISHIFGLPVKAEWVLVLTNLLNIFGALVGSLTIHRFGKRGIALWSMSINTVLILGLGVCAMNLHWSGWVSLTLFSISFSVSGYGMLSLPWMYIAEVYPLEVRGIAAGLSGASGSLIIFISTKTYMNTVSWFGLHGTLIIYSLISFFGCIFIYFYVPETEGKSLEEIMQFFAGNKHRKHQTNQILRSQS